MRRILFIFLASILATSCSPGDNDLDRFGLKGKVKTISEVQHEAVHKDDQWTPGKALYSKNIINYDREGMYSTTIILALSGDTLGTTSTRRDGSELVEEIYRSRVDGRSSRTIMDRVSDEQVNFEVWEGETQHYEGANFFDSRGRMIRQVRVRNDREENAYFVYEKDRLVESYQEDENGNKLATQLFEYMEFDDKGNWTRRLVYLDDDRIVPEMITVREYSYY